MGQRTGRLLAALVALGIDTEVGDDGLHAGRFDPRVEACITAPPPPAGMRWTIVTAWLLGATAGRFAGQALARRTGSSTLAVLGGLLTAPVALAGTYVVAVPRDGTAPWPPYMIMCLRIPALLGVAALLIAVAALRRRGRGA
jgi:hypothetical protein